MSPQYEYRCSRCQSITTKLVESANQKPARVSCGCGGKAESIISAPNFKINGAINPPAADPFTTKLNKMDSFHKDESGEENDIEKGIRNIADDPDLYSKD